MSTEADIYPFLRGLMQDLGLQDIVEIGAAENLHQINADYQASYSKIREALLKYENVKLVD